MEEAQAKFNGWNRIIDKLALWQIYSQPSQALVEILSDDLNTVEAISFLNKMESSALIDENLAAQFGTDVAFLGVASLRDPMDQFLFKHLSKNANEAFAKWSMKDEKIEKDAIDVQFVEASIRSRLAFLAAKNFAEADRIRDELLAQGIQLKDSKDSVTGERVTSWEVKR